MMMCKKCRGITAAIFLVLGILYLLADLTIGGWNFWGISWYTALFLTIGVTKFASGHCPDCQKCESGMKKK